MEITLEAIYQQLLDIKAELLKSARSFSSSSGIGGSPSGLFAVATTPSQACEVGRSAVVLIRSFLRG